MNSNTEATSSSNLHFSNTYGRIVFIAIVVILLAATVIVTAIRYSEKEYQRDLHHWEVQMDVLLDARASAVESWVSRQYMELESLANNMSLQLYLTELNFSRTDEERMDADAAATEFLRNFLVATAVRTGFAAEPSQARSISANIGPTGDAGIALLDNENRTIVTTDNMPKIDEGLQAFIDRTPRGGKAMRDLYININGYPSVAFIIPVFAVQGEPIPSQQMGKVLAVKRIDQELFPLLKRPPATEQTAESVLVRIENGVVYYLSPLRDGSSALTRTLKLERKDYDVEYIASHPNGFDMAVNYAMEEVLVTGRPIAMTPWTLLHTVTKQEALAESFKRRTAILASAILMAGLFLVSILAIWRHSTSIKAEEEAHRFKELAKQFRAQKILLRLVADNQPDAMFLIDSDGCYRFVNRKATKSLGLVEEEMLGKCVASVIGPVEAREYQDICQTLLDQEIPAVLTRVQRRTVNGEERVVQAKYIPLQEIPDMYAQHNSVSGMLVVEQDITAAIREREQRERLLSQLIDTLVRIVDQRDPYSARHSEAVSELAQEISVELHVSDAETETAFIAGKLMNLGKVMLPKELLAKKEKLTEEERQNVSDAIMASADYLRDLEFNGDVAETIRQCQENVDGSGPLGMKGKEILLTAKIVKLANDFVAMTSRRSYRDKMPKEKVLEIFMQSINEKYDRKIVVALASYLDKTE